MVMNSWVNWSDIFEEQPQIAYASRLDNWLTGQGKSRHGRQRNQMMDMFRDVQSHYLSALGNQIRSGQAPTLRFDDWLGDSNQFNFGNFYDQNFMSRSPERRGAANNWMYTPRVRQLLQL